MDKKSLSHGVWAVTAPEPPTTEILRGEKKAGVAIIGGGYTGVAAAIHLAEAGGQCCHSRS